MQNSKISQDATVESGLSRSLSIGWLSAPPATTTNGDADPSLVKAGYSVMRRHGVVYYCRTEILTGQRIGTRVCLTAVQIQDEKQNVIKARDMMNQPSYQCLGTSCSN